MALHKIRLFPRILFKRFSTIVLVGFLVILFSIAIMVFGDPQEES